MALVIACAALVGPLVAGAIRMQEIASDHETLVTGSINVTASSLARELGARLELADALARSLTASDGGAGGARLRERMLSVAAFRGVALSPFATLSSPAALPPLTLPPSDESTDAGDAPSADEWRTLQADNSVLRVVASDGAAPAVIYLLRPVDAAGIRQLARFEVDPGWLWPGAAALPQQDSIVVLDPAEHLIVEGGAPPPEIVHLFAHSARESSAGQRPTLRDWQQDGVAWRAAITPVMLPAARVFAAPWSLVVYAKLTAPRVAMLALFKDLLPLLLLAAAASWLASWYLMRRWQPALARLQAEPQVQRRLAETDRLLLESAELEQSIEPILVADGVETLAQQRGSAEVLRRVAG